MKNKIVKTILSLAFLGTLTLVGCSSTPTDPTIPASTPTPTPTDSVDSITSTEPTPIVSSQESVDTVSPAESSPTTTPSILTYVMEEYTEAPNDKSDVKIQYPVFSGENSDVINAMIKSRIESYVKDASDLYNNELGVTFDYGTDITLLNTKFLSMIIWGYSYVEGGAHPNDDLKVFNLDLQTLQEISLSDLYRIDDEFEALFFVSSYYPTAPETSYDSDSFEEMRNLQTKEYLSISPFQLENNVNYFLKADGIVFTMPAIHATGSDHFEAQMDYTDIQSYYIPENRYWIN